MRQLHLDRLIVVPAGQPPHRDAGTTPPELRYRMAEAAFPGPGRVEVSRIELDRDGPDYTADTLEKLAPEGRLFLIVGADHADLPGWHAPERVRELATLVVAPRPGVSPAGSGAVDGPDGARRPRLDGDPRGGRPRRGSGRSRPRCGRRHHRRGRALHPWRVLG